MTRGALPPPELIHITGQLGLAEGFDASLARAELLERLDRYQEGRRRLERRPRVVVDRAVVETDGFFELTAPEAGPWLVRLSAPEHATLTWPTEPVVASTDLDSVGLAWADAMYVHVVDGAGGELAHASINLANVESMVRGGRTYLVDEDDAKPPGAKRIVVWLRRLTEPAMAADASGDFEVAAPGHLVERIAHSAGPRTVRLSRAPGAADRTLRAVGEDGQPVADVLVLDTRRVPLALTGGDGRAAPILLAPGETVRLLAADGRCADWTAANEMQATAILRPPVLLRGSVSDDRGEPLEGAWVSVRDLLPRVLTADALEPALAVTDSSGRFAMPIEAEREVQLTTYAANHLSTWTRAPLDEEPIVKIVLRRAVSAIGRVVAGGDATAPVARAIVSATPNGPLGISAVGNSIRHTARSGTDGRFSFRGLVPEVSYSFLARAPGFAPTRVEARTPNVPDGLHLSIQLGPGSAATGRVVDEAGSPVIGATVSLVPVVVPESANWSLMEREGDNEPTPVATEGNGVFEVRLLAAGRYDVKAHAAGFAVGHVPAVTLEGPSTDLGEIVLAKGLELVGRVEDGEGEPIGGATVSFRTDRSSQPPGSTQRSRSSWPIFDDRDAEEGPATDDEGRFAIGDLAAGQTLDLHVRAEGYASKLLPGLVVPRDEELLVQLDRAGTLTGRVVDREGAPIQAQVKLQRADTTMTYTLPSGARGLHFTGSAEDGSFTFADVSPGDWRLEASARGFRAAERDVVPVVGGENSSLPDLVLDREETGTVSGSVVDSNGVGVQAWVTYAEPGGRGGGSGDRSDASGGYVLREVPVGPREFTARRDGGHGSVRTLEIVPGENLLDFVVEGATLEGRVVAESGSPLESALLSLHWQSSAGHAEPGTARRSTLTQSGIDGGFRFVDLVPGRYVIGAQKPGWAQRERALAVDVAGDGVTGIDVVMLPGGVIRGRLLGLAETELREVAVNATGLGRFTGVVAADATYEIRGVGPGEWMVSGTLPSRGRDVRRTVRVGEDGRPIVVDLDFEELGWSLRGRVVTAGGEPYASAMVIVRGGDAGAGGWRQMVTDFEGRFLFAGLPEGSYQLEVRTPRVGEPTMPKSTLAIVLDGDREVVVQAPP